MNARLALTLIVATLGALTLLVGPVAVCGLWLPYATVILATLGCAWRFWRWASTPVPFPIGLTGGQNGSLDAPTTAYGAFFRLVVEAVTFRSLWRNTRAVLITRGPEKDPRLTLHACAGLAVWSLLFHTTFFFILLRHTRLWLEPVPVFLAPLENIDTWLDISTPRLYLSGLLFLCALVALGVRRLGTALMRCLSLPGDYAVLALLFGIGASGMAMRHFWRIDLTNAKLYILSLVRLCPDTTLLATLPLLFFLHMLLACLLLGMLPFSRLLHGPGLFLTPTRTFHNATRTKRLGNGWQTAPHHGASPFRSYNDYEVAFRADMQEAGLLTEAEAEAPAKAVMPSMQDGA